MEEVRRIVCNVCNGNGKYILTTMTEESRCFRCKGVGIVDEVTTITYRVVEQKAQIRQLSGL